VTSPHNKKIDKKREEILVSNVTYFKVLFFKETEWKEKWNKKESNPKVIQLTITSKNNKKFNFSFIR